MYNFEPSLARRLRVPRRQLRYARDDKVAPTLGMTKLRYARDDKLRYARDDKWRYARDDKVALRSG